MLTTKTREGASVMDQTQQVLGTIIVYLYESNEPELATLLEKCKMVDLPHYSTPHYREVTLFGPKQFTDFVNVDAQKYKKIVAEAITRSYVNFGLRAGSNPYVIPASYITFAYGLVELTYIQATQHYVQGYLHQIPSNTTIHIISKDQNLGLNPIAIFPAGSYQRDLALCFTLMPFSSAFQPVYDDAIRPAVTI
jgi:hypothetical protein